MIYLEGGKKSLFLNSRSFEVGNLRYEVGKIDFNRVLLFDYQVFSVK